MEKLSYFVFLLSLFLIICVFTGCSSLNGDPSDTNETFYDEELFAPGTSIPATRYEDSENINLYIKSGDGGNVSFQPLINGAYVAPGTYTLGVNVASRTVNDEVIAQRVFVSDGGEYSNEAELDEDSGYYLCDFTIGEGFITYPILVQVAYPDGSASKEKIVVATRAGLRAQSGKLVKEGLGITLSADILDSLKPAIENMITDMISNATVKEFKPALSNGPDEKGIFSLDLDIGILPVSLELTLNDTYSDENDEEKRALTIGIEDLLGGGVVIDFLLGLLQGLGLSEDLDKLVVMPVSFPLVDMLSGFGESDNGDGDNNTAELMENLQLDTTLFINLFGMPEETDSDFVAIGAGLFAADSNLVETDAEGRSLWPDVEIDNTDTHIDMSGLKTGKTDLGLAISMYNLNQMLSDMMPNLKIVLKGKLIESLVTFIPPQNASDEVEIHLTVNPAGIALGMMDSQSEEPFCMLTANDTHLEIFEAGNPMALLSLDLSMELGISVRRSVENELFLDLVIEPLLDISHVHVLKDNKGIGILDHSDLILMILEPLMGAGGTMTIPISLSNLGLSSKASAVEPGKIEFDDNDNCFMNLALESIDTSSLGICFISTAGL